MITGADTKVSTLPMDAKLALEVTDLTQRRELVFLRLPRSPMESRLGSERMVAALLSRSLTQEDILMQLSCHVLTPLLSGIKLEKFSLRAKLHLQTEKQIEILNILSKN
jgi:hypothetical protein